MKHQPTIGGLRAAVAVEKGEKEGNLATKYHASALRKCARTASVSKAVKKMHTLDQHRAAMDEQQNSVSTAPHKKRGIEAKCRQSESKKKAPKNKGKAKA